MASVVVLVTGMAYMFWWGPVVVHAPVWTTGGDLWGILRGAHYVGWGDLGGVYTPGNGVVTFPGMEVLLAPVAMVAGVFHLSESYGSFFLPHPTAALVLQPVELILASTVIFAADALAERLGTGRGRRSIVLGRVGGGVAGGGRLGSRGGSGVRHLRHLR